MDEVNDVVYKKAIKIAPVLYDIWHCTGHETPWEDLSAWQRELMIRCAEQTILAIAPDVWDEGRHDAGIMLPVDPPRKLGNPYL